MKLLDRYIEQKSPYKIIVQFALTMLCLYIANEKTIDIWRSLTGH
jgi:hypothetical protein